MNVSQVSRNLQTNFMVFKIHNICLDTGLLHKKRGGEIQV
jgi:hypothetical protein